MKIFIKVSLGCILIASLLWACGGNDAGDNSQDIRKQQRLVLEGAVLRMMSPLRENLGESLIALQSKTETFCTVATGSHTSNELEVLQAAWKEVMNLWMKFQVVRIDPIAHSGLKLSIQFWPDPGNKVGKAAEQIVVSSTAIDQTLISNSTVQSQGLPMLEYLLFSGAAGDPLADLNGSEGVRRCDLLGAVTENLSQLSGALHQRWLASNDSPPTYPGSDTFATEQAAIDELVNGMVELLEIVQVKKVGDPLGGTNSNPQAAESYRSLHSLNNIVQNLVGLRELYLGGQGYGFDDYLSAVVNRGTVAAEMESLIQQSISAAQTISLPLTNAVLNADQKALVQALEQQILTLTNYIKADFADAMNTRIGFNANDGD